MADKIAFNPQGGQLWIKIEMRGLYFITYTYQLWAATRDEPPVLTNPLKHGSNNNPQDNHHPVLNDYNQTEPVSKFVDRTIQVEFRVKAMGADDGYNLSATVLQGNTFDTATVCGSTLLPAAPPPGTVGSTDGMKSEMIIISLISI